MSHSVKILSGFHTVNPKPFLTGLLKARIIAFNFSPERINLFKGNTVTVNRKSVIIGKRNIFGTALFFLYLCAFRRFAQGYSLSFIESQHFEKP